MATNKNQHYVPRCHFKPFTLDGAGLAINLFNVERGLFVENAPLKSQCSRDYFYGNSAILESSIQELEQLYAGAVRRVRFQKGRMSDEDSFLLKTFWVFQHLRTEAIQQSVLEMSREMESALGQPHPEITIDPKQATLTALGAFSKNPGAIADLSLVLIENRTSVPFVTSDNPAIKSNRWAFTNITRDSACFGMHSAGLIGFLPLAPDLLAMMYDKDIYSIRHVDGRLVTRDEDEVYALNEHQLTNCFANVYSTGSFSSRYQQELPKIKALRSIPRSRVSIFTRRPGDDDKRYYASTELDTSTSGEALIVTSTYYARPTAWPSFLGWRPNGYFFSNGSGVGETRRAMVRTGGRPFRKCRTRR